MEGRWDGVGRGVCTTVLSVWVCHSRVRLCLFLGTGDCASSPPLRSRKTIYPFPKADDALRVPVPLSPGCGPTGFPRHSSPPAVSLLYRQTRCRAVATKSSEAPRVKGAIGKTSWPDTSLVWLRRAPFRCALWCVAAARATAIDWAARVARHFAAVASSHHHDQPPESRLAHVKTTRAPGQPHWCWSSLNRDVWLWLLWLRCGRWFTTIVFIHETPMHAPNWCGRTFGSQTPGVPATPSPHVHADGVRKMPQNAAKPRLRPSSASSPSGSESTFMGKM